MLRSSLAKQDSELFPAIAAHHINLSQLLMKQRRDLAQNVIAQQVAEFIVERLEMIDVGHDYSHARAVSAGPLDLFHDAELEIAAVKNAGQAIQISQLLDSLDIVRILDRCRTDVGYGLERAQFDFAKGVWLGAVEHQDA